MVKPKKTPTPFVQEAHQAIALRNKLGLNQSIFWSRVHVTQSGGSRYESGRNIPIAVQILLHLAYASDTQAKNMLDHLRTTE